jgi:transcriptional regulator with XRE-family HTH domain
MELGKNLKRYREAKGWTQEQLAHEAGLVVATVNRVERGANESPTMTTLKALADALGVKVESLVRS